jgi:UDP-glucuronate 4-epimerase
MKILVTGVAGFIGYSFSKYLLASKKYKIIGIDNLNNYYDPKIKKKRLELLSKYKNFKFQKIDLCVQKKIDQIFKKNKFDFVFHFAAQAGVRYSIEQPRKYIDSNINGFFNIIENVKKYKVKRLFYASSSSVYGENNNFPLNEKEKIYPKNIYSLTKKINEEISSIYKNFYNVNSTGLRFFTVYGEWGRPDMMMLKFIDAFFTKKKFELFNYGNHYRDFTYIGDLVKMMGILLLNHKKLKDNDVLNVCSNQPINLKKVIAFLQKQKIRPVIKKKSLQKADILKTHGDNTKILKITKYKNFINWKIGISRTIKWYLDFYVNTKKK